MAGDNVGFGAPQKGMIDRKGDHFSVLHLPGGRECRHEGDAEIGANETLQDQEGVGRTTGLKLVRSDAAATSMSFWVPKDPRNSATG
jgi:hypothetical protein